MATTGFLAELHKRMVSTDAGNALQVGADGRLYVGVGAPLPTLEETPAPEPPPEEPPPESPPTEPPPAEAFTPMYTQEELDALTKTDLEVIAAERGTPVTGTGSGGSVLKSDLVTAILEQQAAGV